MDEQTWLRVVAPMMLDNDGTTVFVYTPPSSLQAVRSMARDPMFAPKLYLDAEQRAARGDPRWECITFTSHDNPHLNSVALAEITQDMSDRDYRQENLAEDIFDTPGALWDRKLLDRTRVAAAPETFELVVVSIDPSKSSAVGSDECGVVVCGLAADSIAYVLEDLSAVAAPEEWAQTACDAVLRYVPRSAHTILVAEDNAGGEMIRTVIQSVSRGMPIELVPATVDKYLRAYPVRGRWGMDQCRIVGHLERLEYQMTAWTKGARWSPDRLDAMVHGIRRLLLPVASRQPVYVIHDSYEEISPF
jgi:phage terminase large subunit-like protein